MGVSTKHPSYLEREKERKSYDLTMDMLFYSQRIFFFTILFSCPSQNIHGIIGHLPLLPLEGRLMTFEEQLDYDGQYIKKFHKKLKNTPRPMQILQKRTLNSALAILRNIQDIPFDRLSMSLYFFTQDVKMGQFTRAYESQIELAAVNPDRFVMGLHKFYTDLANKIRKENLYTEFFEFHSRCARVRYQMKGKYEDDVLLAYMNILIQHTEYLRPSKFDFSTVICGMTTDGEIMTVKDPYPNIDMPGYDIQEAFLVENKNYPFSFLVDAYKKYGYEVSSPFDIDVITNRDKIQSTTTHALMPFINEYTFDILPITPFSALTTNLTKFHSSLNLNKITASLKQRKRTLPTNGITIQFKDNPLLKSLLLKEVLFDDAIYMLYRLSFQKDGDISGYYDTKGEFIFSVLYDDYRNLQTSADISSLILYCYACYTLKNPSYNMADLKEHFYVFPAFEVEAEGFLQGGKLLNVYNPKDDTEGNTGTARKGNDDYTKETRAIQGYIRKLPIGRQASKEAVEYAESLGYTLDPDETYVRPFIKQVFRLKVKEQADTQ